MVEKPEHPMETCAERTRASMGIKPKTFLGTVQKHCKTTKTPKNVWVWNEGTVTSQVRRQLLFTLSSMFFN